MADPRLSHARPALGPAIQARLAAGYLALVVYGSLVPLRYRATPLAEAVGRFRGLPWLAPTIGSRSDWAVNILLFIPMGYLLMAMVCVDRPRVLGLRALPAVALACVLISGAIEFVQMYFPPRVPSSNDVFAESIGGLAGAALWLARGGEITSWARRLLSASGPRDLAGRIFPVYLVLLVVAHVWPPELITSPAELVHKYREGRILPFPFASTAADFWGSAAKAVRNAAWYAPVGWLIARRPGRAGRGLATDPLGMSALGFGIAGLVESLQVVVASRVADATDVLTGGLAVVGAWYAGGAGERPRAAAPSSRPAPRRAAALLLWGAALLVAAWSPFDFAADWDAAGHRPGPSSLIPFADYQAGGEDLRALDAACSRIVLFAPVGAILAPRRGEGGRGRGVRGAVLAGLALALALELGQFWLPGRYPGVTDVLLETCGAWLGAEAAARLSVGPSRVLTMGRGY